MGLGLVNVQEGEWDKIRRNFQRLNSILLGPTASPTWAGLTLTGLTASRLASTDASKGLASVSNLASWVAGTANEVDVADDGDGTITIGIVNPLIVGKGGTGVATLTDHGLLLGSGTDAVTPLGVATNGQLPIGSTGADPVLGTLTGTANQITVTNTAGGITLSLPSIVNIGGGTILTNPLRINKSTDACIFIMDVEGLGIPAEHQSWGLRTDRAVNGDFQIARGAVGTMPATNVLYFDPSGNVGVGKYAPGTLLDVAGVITATGGTSTDWNTAYTHSQVAGGDSVHVSVTENTNWDAAYTHKSNNGTDHSYIDQSVKTSASPSFARATIGGVDNSVSLYVTGLNSNNAVIQLGTTGTGVYKIWGGDYQGELGLYTSGANAIIFTTNGTARLRIGGAGGIDLLDSELSNPGNIVLKTTVGTKIGTATNQLLGFYNATPVDQPATVADPAGGLVIDIEARTAIVAIIDRLQELGLVA